MLQTAYAARQDINAYEYRQALRRRRMKLRRQREIRKNILMILLGIIMVVGLSLSYHAITSQANSQLGQVEQKCYTSVVIEGNDTLWSLAQEYAGSNYKTVEDYISEVMQINHLDSDEITAGNYLILPYYRVVQ